jgi:uncharacterized protein
VWKQLVDQWALVTGASSGIGAEFARQLAARGMHVILTARRGDLMEELADELRAKHATRCEIIPADLSEPGGVASLLEEIRRRGLTVQLLVNNAGFGVVGEVDDADVERLLQLVRLNISALVELTYRLLPEMLNRRSGVIINLSSLSGFQPVAYMSVYAASKAFVLHFTEALAIELRHRKVSLHAVCPGVTRTPFFDIAGAAGWLQKHASQSPEDVVRKALKAVGTRKMVVVPGWRNWLLTLVVRFIPRRRVVKESMRYFQPKRGK